MQSKRMSKKKVTLLTVMSVLLSAVLVLSGVGIYLKLTHKEKSPAIVNPLDFSVDAWDGKTVDGLNFNESYAGRKSNTKTINSAASFMHFINEVNSGNTFETYTIYLNKNIDLKGQTISSIGTSEHPFMGIFDGGHYTIMNANIDGDGLFGNTENATIKNVGLYNSNTSLIHKAINTNVENTFVRLGSGLLVDEFISNNGTHEIKNSFVDSKANGLINKLDTNNSSENQVAITSCYFTNGETAIVETVGETFTTEENVIKATNKSDFNDWSYSTEYSSEKDWCSYDYLENSQKLDFVYPIQSGFAKVFLTGSCYESVMVAGDTVIDTSNLATAFVEADKVAEAEVNLLVEKIFMEAQAEVSNAEVKVNAVKDTTIIRGENNTESMFVGKGDAKLTIGNETQVGVASGSNEQPTLTIDGNKELVEKNNLESGAVVVAYGGEVEIKDNVIIKDNVNNSDVAYGGGVLLYNTDTMADIKATFENCRAEYGGAVAVIGTTINSVGSCYNCSAEKAGGALYLAMELPSEETEAVRAMYGEGLNVQPTLDLDTNGTNTVADGTVLGEEYNDVIFTYITDCDYGGSAIYCDGDLTISGNPIFESDQNPGTEGAIWCKTLTISGDPIFRNQLAASAAINATTVNFNNGSETQFEGIYNYSGHGGAIYATTVNINAGSAPTFTNCISEYAGGAIYATTINISGSPTFTGNQVYCDYGGGALYATTININEGANATFTSNTTSVRGGAICCSGNMTIAGNAEFTANDAEEKGGAIYAGSIDINESANVTFTSNGHQYAALGGGAIYSEGDVYVGGNATFKSNHASDAGGAILCGGRLVISGNPVFTQNTIDAGSGSAVYSQEEILILGNSQFVSNEGTGCAVGARTNITISGSPTFTSNIALCESGGAIATSGEVNIEEGANPTFSYNSAGTADDAGNGGAIYCWGGLTISGNAMFVGNSSSTSGGAIYCNGDAIITGNATFTGNSAGGKGGAIYCGGDLIITELPSEYQQVEYIQSSGTQYINTGFTPNQDTRVVCDFQLVESTASFIFGSRDSAYSKAYTFNMSGTPRTFVSAYNTSGNVNVRSEEVDLNRHVVDKNKNKTLLDGKDELTHTYATFTCPAPLNLLAGYNGTAHGYLPSKAKLYGCQIYDNGKIVRCFIPCYQKSNNEAGLYDVVNGVFYPNAGTGSFVCGDAVGNSSANQCVEFTSNTSTGDGGAIYYKGNLIISNNAIFTSNTANGNGGAIAINASGQSGVKILKISGVATFDSNTSSKNGGAIFVGGTRDYEYVWDEENEYEYVYVSGPVFEIDISNNAVFTENSAGNSGGAVCSVPNLTISGNPMFAGNSAKYGGAIDCVSHLIIEGNPTFSGNTSLEEGGAILCEIGAFISGSPKFYHNTASEGTGGAITTYGYVRIGLLPAEYQAVEYLESTGTQYIDLKHSYSDFDEFKIDFMLTQSTGAVQGVFGNGNAGGSGVSLWCDAGMQLSSTIGGVLGSQYVRYENEPLAINTRYEIQYERSDVYLNGNKVVSVTNSRAGGTQSDFSLFRRYGTKTMVGRIYGFTIQNGFDTLRKLIPCYRKSDNVAGMYDLIQDRFYTNSGSGNFIVGPELNDGKAEFIGNTATEGGGAIYSDGISIDIYSSAIFDGNTEQNVGGGAIYGSVVVYSGAYAEFKNNYSAYEGGAVSGFVVVVGNALFHNNSTTGGSGTGGGAIYGDVVIEGKAVFSNNDAVDNESAGGAIYSTGVLRLLGEITFANNSATTNGGAICIASASNMDLSGNFLFKSNTAGWSGGAIYAGWNISKTINFSGDSVFKSNTAGDSGGAIHVDKNLEISGSPVFDGNECSMYGAVYAGNAKITGNPIFKNNTANDMAGGCTFITVEISGNPVFENNRSEVYYGQALYATDIIVTGEITLKNNYNPNSTSYQYEILHEGLFKLGKGIKVLSDSHPKLAQFICNEYNYVLVTGELDGVMNVYYDGYDGCYVFENISGAPLVNTNPFNVINRPGMVVEYNTIEPNYGVLTSGPSQVIVETPRYVETGDHVETKIITLKSPVAGTFAISSRDESIAKVLRTGVSASSAGIASTQATEFTVAANQAIDVVVQVVGEGETKLDIEFTPTDTTKNLITNEVITFNVLPAYTISFMTNIANNAYGTVSVESVTAVQGDIITINDDGSLKIGDNAAVVATPKTADAQYHYTFVGWSGVKDTVNHHMLIIANFERTLNVYTITIEADEDYGTVTRSSIPAAYGTPVKFNANTVTIGNETITANINNKNAQYTYSFVGWEGKIEVVDGEATIKAIFDRTINSYTVTFDHNGGTVGETSRVVTYGEAYGTLPTPSRPGYEFDGWFGRNLADLSKAIKSTSTNNKFTYDNATGSLIQTSAPSKFDYILLYLERDCGVQFELGKTYYFGGIATVTGKSSTTVSTAIQFGVSTAEKDAQTYPIWSDGVYEFKGSFVYTAQENIRFKMHGNYGSNDFALVRFDNIYLSEVDQFEPFVSVGEVKHDTIMTVGADHTLYARWTAKTDTAYRVEHYQEKIGIENPNEATASHWTIVSADTLNGTGTTDSSITPDVKTYTGFTSPTAKTVTIAGDGSTVVKYYYTRNQYTLTLQATDMNWVDNLYANVGEEYICDSGKVDYGNTVEVYGSAAGGYEWVEWQLVSGTALVGMSLTEGNTSGTMPADNCELKSILIPADDTPYRVYHYKENIDVDSPDFDNPDNGEHWIFVEYEDLFGVTGSTITPAVKQYDGFTSPEPQTVEIGSWGDTVVYYLYTRNSYNLTVTAGTGISSVTGGGEYDYEKQVSITATVKNGYTWSTWTVSGTTPSVFTTATKDQKVKIAAGDTTLTATATANTNTPYRVEHYQENIGVDAPDINNVDHWTIVSADTLNGTGTTDSSITPDVKTYTGFTSPTAKTVTIAGDGSTVVKYYYTRNQYTLTLQASDDYMVDCLFANVGEESIYDSGKVDYGNTVEVFGSAANGYEWVEWQLVSGTALVGMSLTEGNTSGTMPADDCTLKSILIPADDTPYTIYHYQENIGVDDPNFDDPYNSEHWTLVKTENLTGTTGSTITPSIQQYEGFTSPELQAVEISGDGSTEVHYLYTRNQYTARIRASGDELMFSEYGIVAEEDYNHTDSFDYEEAIYIFVSVIEDLATWSYWEIVQGPAPDGFVATERDQSLTMPANDFIIKPVAEYLDYTLTILVNPAGYGSVSQTTATQLRYEVSYILVDGNIATAYNGVTSETTEIVATPTADGEKYNYSFVNWTYEGEDIVDIQEYNGALTVYGNMSITANFTRTAIDYSISYELNGGSVATANPTTYNCDTETFTLNNPTKTGYTFAGWTGSNGSTPQKTVTIAKGSFGNKTYTANWTANEYTVTFNANGGSVSPTSKKVTFGTAYGDLPTPTRAGYTPAGWHGKNLFDIEDAGTSASWTSSSYRYYPVYVGAGNKVTLSYNNSLEMGLSFYFVVGTEEAKKGTSNGSWMYHSTSANLIKNSITITAKEDYIYLNVAGTANATYEHILSKDFQIEYGSTATSYEPYVGEVKADTVMSVAANHTLYARWTVNTDTQYTVNYWKENVGIASPSTSNAAHWTLAETVNTTGTTDTQVTPEVKNYAGFTVPSAQTVTIKGDGSTVVNYYYHRLKYKLTLTAGTGISAVAGGGTYDYEEDVEISATVSYGYSWSTWATSETQPIVFTATTKDQKIKMAAGAATLTATATGNTYTVTFDANGGTVSESSRQVVFGEQYGTLPTPSRPGYEFNGWYGKNLLDLTKTNTERIELYEDLTGFNIKSGQESNFANCGYIGNFSELCPALKVGDQFVISFETNAIRNNVNVNYIWLNKYKNTLTVGKVYTCTQEMLESSLGVYSGSSLDVYFKNFQVEIGTTATSYEPYASGYKIEADTVVTAPYNHTLHAQWTALTDTAYKVIHYTELIGIENPDRSNPAHWLDVEEETFTGTTDSSITPAVKTYEGFTSPDPITTTIAGDGSTVVKYYYTRNQYDVTINVKEAGYGTVSKANHTLDYGTLLSTNGNELSIHISPEIKVVATPTDSNAQYTYAFANWTGVSSMVESDMTITANFTRTINKYTITWINWDESVLRVDTGVLYGTTPKYQGATPTKPATAEHSYTHIGWDPTVAAVTGDATYKAVFSTATNTYTITIVANNSAFGTITPSVVENVVYGSAIADNKNNTLTIGTTVVTANAATDNDQYDYEFAGWEIPNNVTKVESDLTIKANFTRTTKSYTITIEMADDSKSFGSITNASIVAEYGSKIHAVDNILTIASQHSAVKIIDDTPKYEYTFAGWENADGMVVGNRTIKAKIAQTIKQYTIKFVVEDESAGSVSMTSLAVPYETKIVVEDNKIIVGEITITATAKDGYSFVEWAGVVGVVNGEITITARFA